MLNMQMGIKRFALLALSGLATFGVLPSSAGNPAGASVTLRRGEVTVVTVDSPNGGYLRYAACEMTNFLSRALGATVPHLKNRLPEKGVAIILGTNAWSRAAGLAPERLKRDGYQIRTAPNRVYVAGVDEPGWVSERINRPWDMCTQHATVFAAYDFLERFCGFRFYFPGEYGIIIPQSEKIELPAIDYTTEPDFRVRRYSYSLTYGDGPMPAEWGNTNYVNLSNRQRLRMRMASEYVPCCHGQYVPNFSKRFKDTHPEYFRLRKNGTRHTEDTRRQPQSANAHLCQSSKVWDELYEDAAAYFTGKDAKTRGLDRWAQQAMNGRYYDVMPNDGMPPCECKTCKEWYAKAKDPRYPYTPLVWTKTVELANRLKKNGIPGTITQMAYSSYRGIPDIDLPDNIAVQVAEIGPWSERCKRIMDRDDAEVRAWAKKVKGGVWLWNYVGKFQCAGWNLAGVPIVTPHSVGRYYKRMAGDVFGAYMEIFAETYVWQYLNVYVFSRLAWDNQTDPEAVIAEHHRLMFGKGAAAMAKFFDEIERAWVYEISGRTYDSPLGPASVAARDYEVWTRIYTPERLASFVRLFDEAAASVPPGSMEARRIAFMRREFLDVMQREAAKCLKTIDIAEEEAYRAKNPDRTIFPGGDCSSLDGWKVECGDVTIDRTVFRSAPGAIKLVATDASSDKDGPFLRAAVTIPLPKLKPDRYYRLSWYEKLENVTPCGAFGGFSMCMCDTVDRSWPWPNYHVGTTGWFRQYYDLKTRPGSNAEGQSYLRPRIVTGTGTVWIDDIRLEEHK